MTANEFGQASLGQLAVLTGVDRQRWSRYLSGKVAVTERTLSKAAPRLGMTPSQLLGAILECRAIAQELPARSIGVTSAVAL